jgi:hypothetical protein
MGEVRSMSTPDEFIAQVGDWCDDAIENIDLVVRGGAQLMFEAMTERQASAKETGGGPNAYVIGKVPVDTGFLVGTSELRVGAMRLGGTPSSAMPPDFVAGLLGWKAGEDIEFVFTAPYARRMEYGFVGNDALGRMYNQGGRLFVTTAIARWQEFMDLSASRFRT